MNPEEYRKNEGRAIKKSELRELVEEIPDGVLLLIELPEGEGEEDGE